MLNLQMMDVNDQCAYIVCKPISSTQVLLTRKSLFVIFTVYGIVVVSSQLSLRELCNSKQRWGDRRRDYHRAVNALGICRFPRAIEISPRRPLRTPHTMRLFFSRYHRLSRWVMSPLHVRRNLVYFLAIKPGYQLPNRYFIAGISHHLKFASNFSRP